MADILEFASWRESGIIACNFATHRSVAAGKVLELFFHRSVSFTAHVQLSCLGEVVLATVKFCVCSKWAPNTSRYPVSGRLIFTIVVFLRYGPRTRPAILSRGGCSCKRQVLCFFEMGPEHVPLSCVGQAILSRAGPCYPVSGRLFLQLLCF